MVPMAAPFAFTVNLVSGDGRLVHIDCESLLTEVCEKPLGVSLLLCDRAALVQRVVLDEQRQDVGELGLCDIGDDCLTCGECFEPFPEVTLRRHPASWIPFSPETSSRGGSTECCSTGTF